MIFGYGLLLTALILSAVAEFYSIMGLVAIFSAAVIPVIIMGASLGLGKIVATVWLHNNWKRAPILFKLYLVPAVAFLMMLTSMGIFGFLSKAHSDQSLISGDSMARVAIYDEKIRISKDNIDANRKALKQMDEAVDQVMGRSSDEKGAEKAVGIRRSQQKERVRLQSEIAAEQKTIAALGEEAAPLRAEFRKVESEVGPIKYIAALVYGDNPDANILEKAVRLVIIMIVLVFDPLALTLILAANKQFEWAREGTGGFVHDEPVPKPKYEPDDGPLTTDQINQLKQSVDAFREVAPPDDPIPCYQCGTPLVNAPGIGLFCPNKECDVLDNVNSGEPVEFTVPVKYQFVDEHHEPEYEPDLSVYNDERLVSKFDKMPVWQEAEVAQEEIDDDDDEDIKAAIKKWKAVNPDDTIKNQRYKFMRGEIAELPWMGLMADNIDGRESRSGFGIGFPENPSKGDTFVRVDIMPSVLYKYNGASWIAVDKNLSDSYTYDSAYIEHLIDKITTGEYDPDLLSDSEHEQVAHYLQTKQSQ